MEHNRLVTAATTVVTTVVSAMVALVVWIDSKVSSSKWQ
jgi:hypothetical protein